MQRDLTTDDLTPNTHDHRFACGTCGADMRFAPENGALACDHCGAHAPLDTGGAQPVRELDYRAALDAQLPHQDIVEARGLAMPKLRRTCGIRRERSRR